MRKGVNMHRDEIARVLDAVTVDQIREFLVEEMKNNGELLNRFTAVHGIKWASRTDYMAMADSTYYEYFDTYNGRVPYGAEVDFGDIIKLAQIHTDRKNYDEAIRAYRELSEAIAKNMDMVDDSDGYYGACFSDAIQGMVECINRQGVSKKWHITYMFEKFMLKEPDYFADDYEDALSAICTDTEDIKHWEDLLDPHIPDTIPNSDGDFSRHFYAVQLIRMKITILKRTKSRMLPDILAKHYCDDHDICILYIEHLKKKDKQAALRIAKEGVRLFPHSSKFRNILHDMYKKTDPEFPKSLRRLFIHDASWKHYDELKQISNDWNRELESIIDELARGRNHYILLGLFMRENMTDRAMQLILQSDDLHILKSYHNDLCALYPEKYHAAYKRHIDKIAKHAHDRRNYKHVKECLKTMKSVPGHEKEFKEFVDYLRERHARQPAFLDEMKRL